MIKYSSVYLQYVRTGHAKNAENTKGMLFAMYDDFC